jgi:hypothetical protein
MRDFDEEFTRRSEADWGTKFRRFLRYLSTRKMECWGFFAAGFLIATIF